MARTLWRYVEFKFLIGRFQPFLAAFCDYVFPSFKFLIGRFQLCEAGLDPLADPDSNSSLAGFSRCLFCLIYSSSVIQIPHWPVSAEATLQPCSGSTRFKFLIGRFQRRKRRKRSRKQKLIQIPHWPVSAGSRARARHGLLQFKFLIGRFQRMMNMLCFVTSKIQIPHWPVSARG